MTKPLTNITGIGLPFAVWLATDGYDFEPGAQRAISATSIMKPVRQILLKERLTEDVREAIDVADLIASRTGHALHDSVEKAWMQNYRQALAKLGYPKDMIDRVVINPTPEDLRQRNDALPIYIEKRGSRQIMGYTISGKFDMVALGELNDTKSTSTFSWTKGSKDPLYALQGSIYKWIHRDIITSDYIKINFFFTDWQRALARNNPDYPQQRLLSHTVPIWSVEQTDAWLRNKLRELEKYAEADEKDIPFCTKEDLWMEPPTFKYYSDPSKVTGKSTKNFTDPVEANKYRAEKGKGIVLEVSGKAKACGYCPCFPICHQKDLYEHA